MNVLDVQLAISQALGLSPCTNGDLNHDGVCNVVDVQLVASAASNACAAWAGGGIASGTTSGVFVKADTTTAGTWMGVYGADGYSVAGDNTVLPSYVTATATGYQPYEWTASTTDPRALQQPSNPTNRLAATWYSPTVLTMNLVFNDGNTHQVAAAILLDWDNLGRSQQVAILDSNNNVLDSRTITGLMEENTWS